MVVEGLEVEIENSLVICNGRVLKGVIRYIWVNKVFYIWS